MRGVNLRLQSGHAIGALSSGRTSQPARTFWRQGMLRLLWAMGLVVLLSPAHARAGLLPFALDSNQVNILGVDGNLTYTASTGELQSTSQALVYAPAPNSDDFALFGAGATISVDLFVTQTGAFSSNGAGITITGSLDLDGDGTPDVSGILLQGTFTDFGAQPAGAPTWVSNALFTIDGGLLTTDIAFSGGGAPFFGGFTIGQQAGIFLFAENVTSGTLGDFTQDFSSDSTKANVGLAAVVPEPSSWIQIVFGIGSLGAFLVCKRPRSAGSVGRRGY
jgi:hypothetical protein